MNSKTKMYIKGLTKVRKKKTIYEERASRRVRKLFGLGMLIPALTMLVAYIANGVFPFGDRGVLIIDSLHQYLPFFTDFHEKLVHGQGMFYSFGGGLGYNLWGTIAYYLASPLNLLMALVSMDHVMDFMAWLILLKISLSGGIFSWYIATRNREDNYLPVAFGCMYALSTFMIGYYFNLMWLDSIMIVPFLMRGIERIVEGKDGRLFGASLFYGLWCNYYIGYMLCLFSCLYWLSLWIATNRLRIREMLISAARFAWFALLSGGMAAMMLVPAYMALGHTESAGSSFPSKIRFYTDWMKQWTGHFALVEPINIYDNQSGVNIYCGVIIMVLVLLYLLDTELRFTERMSKALMMGLLLISMNFNMLNYIWHGFHTQNGLPNRFAFLYIAIILVMGYDALCHLRLQSRFRLFVSWWFPFVFTGYCFWQNIGERPWYVYAVTLALLVVYGILLLLLHEADLKVDVMRNVLTGVMALEMVVTGVYGVCLNGTVSRSTYVNEQICYQTLLPAAENEDAFFRSEIDSQHMRNENMFMGAKGIVLFSSTMPEATVNLCKAIGMEARTNKNGYIGITRLFNDVFGLRYLVSKNSGDTLYSMKKADTANPLNLYENDGALSVGFMVSDNIRDWDISDGLPMQVQENFVRLATGEEDFYYTLRESYSLEEGPTYIIRLHPGEQTYIEFTENIGSVKVKTPQYEKTYNSYTMNLFDLGTVDHEGDDSKANITITYKAGKSTPVPVRVYTVTDEEYKAAHDKLAVNQMQHVKQTGNTLSGMIRADEAGTLLLTIPYDKGWKILVNGEAAEPYRVGEALTGIHLEPGEYEINMTFTPEGWKLGRNLTILCILLFILSCIAEQSLVKRIQFKDREDRNDRSEEHDGDDIQTVM